VQIIKTWLSTCSIKYSQLWSKKHITGISWKYIAFNYQIYR